jgi:hypothetical protein
MRGVVEMVFGARRTTRKRVPAATPPLRPAWCRYIQPRPSPLWKKFSPEERQRGTRAIESYFASLIDSPTQDPDLLFFRGYEQQGSNFLANILPAYRLKLRNPPWSGVVEALGTLIDDEARPLRYDRKHSGTLRRAFFSQIKSRPGGKELIATIRQHSLRGRNGWQLLWQMMRGCAALEPWGYDFGRALDETGVIEYLEPGVPFTGEWAIATWEDRRERFSGFVNGLTGIGWNTFDYILRDLHYIGCLSLFKLDSTNEAFIEKVFERKLNGDRNAYLELLAATGILDEFPPAVINMAIYAFTARNCLGYLKNLTVDGDGGFTLNCS